MKLTPEEYRRRVEGCWIGKNIGGTLGMPMEWNRATNDVSYYTHDISGEPLPNDDLDIQVLWLLALEDNGLDLDAKVLGRYFNELMIFTHAEYGTAKANLRVGLEPPYSGIYKNDFKHSCGSFIRSEIWACLFPGYPALAAKYAFEDAIVDHGDGEGVYAEVFFAALESAAFFEPDLEKLIEIGLTYIPVDCAVARAIRDGVDFARRGVSKETAREYMMQHYIGHIEWHYIAPEDERKGYGEGPFGFDVPSNMFIIAYNLVAGRGDLEKSMCGAVWFGEATDCTAGTIAALHGIRCGIDSIDKKWIEPIGTKIKTISIDPFRMESRIPKDIYEFSDRLAKLHAQAVQKFGLSAEPPRDFAAPAWFTNIYDDMRVVTYRFDYVNVRLDYMGDPVIRAGEPKRIRFLISNTAKSVSTERLNLHLYTAEEMQVLPSRELSTLVTMGHMGSGISAVEFELCIEQAARPLYRGVLEITFEDSKRGRIHHVPFVLLNEGGARVPSKFEKNGPPMCPNQPRV